MEAASEAPARAPDGRDRTGSDSPATNTAVVTIPRWLFLTGVLVVVAGIVLRFVTRSDLWLDEALSVNIARLPLGDISEALRHDGAPPLFYLLLHGWISVFGTSDVAVRALSGVISVATLAAAWFAGRRLGHPGAPGPLRDDPPRVRAVAALVVVVLSTSPFAIRYATEARMYSLVMFLVTAGYLALRRALERPSLGRLAIVALVIGALLYTQYWTIYLLVVVGAAMLWRAWRAPDLGDRRAARSFIVAMIAGFITFTPWLSNFLYQNAHTGTPWGDGQLPWSAARLALEQFAGGTSQLHGESNVLAVLLLGLAWFGLMGAAIDAHHIDLDLRTQPAVRWESAAAASALLLGLVVAGATDGAFDGRYASMMFPLFAMVVAYGFTIFGSRKAALAVLALFVTLGLAGGVRNVLDNRTQAGQVADVLRAEAKPGDVVAYCPDQLGPGVSRLVEGRGLVQMTFPSGSGPDLVDWVDYVARVGATDGGVFARTILARAGHHTIWYVSNPGYHNVENKCDEIASALNALNAPRPVKPARVLRDGETFFEFEDLREFPAR
ncbi:MAG TPA: glycosyltransferase family 39 protein [Acidimicrobiia bacterium]